MRIDTRGSIRPPKFSDDTLNEAFGHIIDQLSRDDVHAIVFRHTEIRVALRVRQLWLAQAKDVADSSAENGRLRGSVSAEPGWISVADEVLEVLRTDQEQLAREAVLVLAHLALCDKVIAALTDPAADNPLTDVYRVGGASGGSPLRHLQLSQAAASKASRRLGAANNAWVSAIDGLVAEANARNSFAGTSSSITLTKIDALPPDLFEEWTAWLLERDGCTILRRHGGCNDQGADVIALTPDGLRIVLQCKHSTRLRNRVDPRYVHELNGTARQEHGADIVGIVTNRTLSDAAQRFAVKHRIHVIDRPVLRRWATFGVSWLPSDRRVTAMTRA